EGGNVRVFDVNLEAVGPALEARCVYGRSTSGASAYVLGVAPDGNHDVSVIGDDVVLLRDGEEPSTLRADGVVAVAGDVSRLWLGHKLVDLTTEQTLLDLGRHADKFRVPAVSPDGQLLAFGTTSGELRVVRLSDGSIPALVRRTTAKGARTIVFSPDGKNLVIGDSDGIEVRAVPGLDLLKTFPTPTWDAAVSLDTIFRIADDRVWPQPLEGHA